MNDIKPLEYKLSKFIKKKKLVEYANMWLLEFLRIVTSFTGLQYLNASFRKRRNKTVLIYTSQS